jgi:hypothetical protein
MSLYSREYQHLKERVEILLGKFIEDQVTAETVNPLDFSPDTERIAAFRLLVHAEVEDYLEKKARAWLDEKESLVRSGSFSVRSTWEFFPISILLDIKLKFAMPFEKQLYSEKIIEIIGKARQVIKDNNGIKSESFMKLSLLCGKMIDEIDSTIAIQLSEYGKARGDVAHKSLSSVSTIYAPSAEKNQVNQIIKSLGIYFYNVGIA